MMFVCILGLSKELFATTFFDTRFCSSKNECILGAIEIYHKPFKPASHQPLGFKVSIPRWSPLLFPFVCLQSLLSVSYIYMMCVNCTLYIVVWYDGKCHTKHSLVIQIADNTATPQENPETHSSNKGPFVTNFNIIYACYF